MDLPTLTGAGVTLRALEEADLDGLVAIVVEPGVNEWWGGAEDSPKLREDLRADGAAFAIEVDGALAGWLDFYEENEPDYRSVGVDISLAGAYQGRGLGPAALRALIGWLIAERGHHRITIDPALANERAIRAYESVGFRRVGVLRQHERLPDGQWRDAMLLDLLASELTDD